MDKKRILETAGYLFSRAGIKSISVDDICTTLGISKKTFYCHYSGKEELVQVYTLDFCDDILEALKRTSTCSDPMQQLTQFDTYLVERLMRVTPVILLDLKRHYYLAFEIYLQHRQRVQDILVSIIESGQQQGVFRREYDASILAMLRLQQLEYILESRNTVSFGELARHQQQLFAHFTAGLLVTPRLNTQAKCTSGIP